MQTGNGYQNPVCGLPESMVDILNIEHLEELNYIETMIHLEEQYRITPTGRKSFNRARREIQREKKETFRYRITTLIGCHCLD